MARMVRAGTLQPQYSHSLNFSISKPPTARAAGVLRLEGIELWNSTNTAPVRTGREGGGHKLTLFPFNGAGRGAIPGAKHERFCYA